MSILHNQNIYPRPYEFDPERWLVQDTSEILDYFQPFSYGPRSCIGRKYGHSIYSASTVLIIEHSFAWMEILKSMATLFRLFDVSRTKSEPTTLREGFFNKSTECATTIRRR